MCSSYRCNLTTDTGSSTAPTLGGNDYASDTSSADGQARGGRRPKNALSAPLAEHLPNPQSTGLSQPAGKSKHSGDAQPPSMPKISHWPLM